MNQLKQFFTTQYLFNINSAFISPKEKLMFFGGVILVLVAIVTKISSVLALNPVDKKYRNKFYVFFLSVGLSTLVWYFFRYEDVTFFGTPFIEWLILLVSLVCFIKLLVNTFRHYGEEKDTWEKEQVRLKYLPVAGK